MTTNEHRVLLYLENNLKQPILEYYDPMRYLTASPVLITDTFIERILEWYLEKSRQLGLIGTYYLYKLSIEAKVHNIALMRVFITKEVSKKLKLFYSLYDEKNFSLLGAKYFKLFPNGRIHYAVEN